jgi:hypothetical protein
MASLTIDTHKAITLLEQHGYTKAEAEGFVAVLQSADLMDVATHGDIDGLAGQLAHLDKQLQATRVELYKVAAAQTLVIVGAVAALVL